MHRRSLLTFGLAVAATPAFAKPRWRTLFDGRSLAGWTPVGEANWRIEDGAAVADTGLGFLVSEEDFGDVAVRAEFWVSDDANSGVFIRCTDPKTIAVETAYEVNIFDRRPDPTYGTGGIVNVAKVDPMPKAGGRWSVMEITARGDRFDVVFNGRPTVTGARDSARSRGRIALQHGDGLVKFRKVEVRSL